MKDQENTIGDIEIYANREEKDTYFKKHLSQTYYYKIGHNETLSLAEFKSIASQLNKKEEIAISNGYIITRNDIDIDELGSIIFKMQEVVNFDNATLPKKVGYANLSKSKGISKNDLLKKLKEQGGKKINIINVTPNIGNIQYVKDWFIEQDNSVYYISQYFDNSLWGYIDMSLPAKDMKKGIINLKLARSIYNLSDLNIKSVFDPFSGLGRNGVAIWDKDVDIYMSDNDEYCKRYVQENIEWIAERVTSKSKLITNDVIEASKLATIAPKEDFKIVTEGYLTDSASGKLSSQEARERKFEVIQVWQNILNKWSDIDNLKEVIFCLPYYITEEGVVDIDVEKEFDLQQFEHQNITGDTNKKDIYYSREKTRIGHMVVKLNK